MYDLTVIGHLTIDKIKEKFIAPGKEAPGGPTFYTSLVVSMLGLKASIASKVGEDYPQRYLDLLESRGIDTSFIHVCKVPTTKFELMYDERVRFLKVIHVCEAIGLEDFSGIPKSNAVHLGPVIGELKSEVYKFLTKDYSLSSLDVQGIMRRIDAEGYVQLVPVKDMNFLKDINLLKATEEEILVLTHTQNLKDALRSIDKIKGDMILVVTSGKQGSILSTPDGELFRAPAYPVGKGDPTGAGDILIGALISSILKGEDLGYALAVGSASASYCIEKESSEKFSLGSDLERRVQRIYSQTNRIKL